MTPRRPRRRAVPSRRPWRTRPRAELPGSTCTATCAFLWVTRLAPRRVAANPLLLQFRLRGPRQAVRQQPDEVLVLEVVGVSQRGVEHPAAVLLAGPRDRFRLFSHRPL